MTFSEYVKSLKKITINDIKDIISQDVINKKETLYGFKEQRGFVFFGEFENGLIQNKYLFVSKNEEILCEEIYDLLKKEYKDNIEFYDERDCYEKYSYYAIINENFKLSFPNYSRMHQEWIYNKVHEECIFDEEYSKENITKIK